jgi:hypothetical protein
MTRMTRMTCFNRLAIALAAALCGLLFAPPILAQQAWPAKPLRFLVPAPGGSSVDIVMRIIADHLKDRLGQPIIVDNKPAAGGTVAANEVARAAADGYTFFVGFNGPLANAPSLYSKLPYDPLKDLVPVVLTGTQPNLLAVGASVAAGNLKEFLALAKSQPGKLNYASVGNGSSSHLSMELLKQQAGQRKTLWSDARHPDPCRIRPAGIRSAGVERRDGACGNCDADRGSAQPRDQRHPCVARGEEKTFRRLHRTGRRVIRSIRPAHQVGVRQVGRDHQIDGREGRLISSGARRVRDWEPHRGILYAPENEDRISMRLFKHFRSAGHASA